jgi:hypothetical protein
MGGEAETDQKSNGGEEGSPTLERWPARVPSFGWPQG